MSGRGGRAGRCLGRGRGRGEIDGSNTTSTQEKGAGKVRKTFSDYVYYVGASRQASEFSIIMDYLINNISLKFNHGNDIANALDSRSDTDFGPLWPVLTFSSELDAATREREDKQNKMLYKAGKKNC
jgi:hypothetical protein